MEPLAQSHQRRVRMMGTVIDLYIDHKDSENLLDTLVDSLIIYEKRFSANDPVSELMQVNQNAGLKAVVVHPDLFKLIAIGKEHSLANDSLLNIAMGPLVQTWRIGFKDAKKPKDETIQNLLKLVDPTKIHLDPKNSSVFLEKPGMLIDLGALAKGFMADLLIDYLISSDVESAMVNLGGNVKILGRSKKHRDGMWRVGIQNECEKKITVKIINQSVVTSGIYERVINNEGKSYHHILDPKTGYPVETDVKSLSIVSDSSLDGEIWTTRLFGKNSKDIMAHIQTLDGIEGLVLTRTGLVLSSQRLNIK